MADGQRERDERGRPRNARPRDGLGRLLPRGAAGVARVPDNLDLPSTEALEEAQRLLDDGLPFHAHEVLEACWKSAPEQERALWQGLAQLAVGLTHCLRGNPVGAASVLGRGRALIAAYEGSAAYDIDVTGLLAWTDELLTQLAGDPVETPATPRLRRPRS